MDSYNTVEYLLTHMGFSPYTHVVVRERGAEGVFTVGGGYMSVILTRYGDRKVLRSHIADNVLYLIIM